MFNARSAAAKSSPSSATSQRAGGTHHADHAAMFNHAGLRDCDESLLRARSAYALICRTVAVVCILFVVSSNGRAATYVVTNVNDPGDGACTGADAGDGCTLREAIATANSVIGSDVITFAPGV